MKTLSRIGLCICILPIFSRIPRQAIPPPVDRDQITQISVINALMLGRYDGQATIGQLLQHGDFGLGTLDHLDGEMIVLDGKVFQIGGDGVVHSVGADRSTPFAVVTPFESDGELRWSQVDGLSKLDAGLNEALPQKNNFLAIRVDGAFSSITLRSVHRQAPPYKPLSEVAKSQAVWTRRNLRGTLVGIRCPEWVAGLNVPGYHWHFLSDDRKVGGHVLDCRLDGARVRYDVCESWVIKLDGSEEFNRLDLGKDQSRELRRVESSRGGDKD
jgi:acetolactate decarboxylase